MVLAAETRSPSGGTSIVRGSADASARQDMRGAVSLRLWAVAYRVVLCSLVPALVAEQYLNTYSKGDLTYGTPSYCNCFPGCSDPLC
jgi:hypothetical protein